jgi:F-type H+-transporting ATPase subunit beta
VAEQFTGQAGKYVTLSETIRGFKEIVDGKHDDVPEQAFLFAGGIEDVVDRARDAVLKAQAEAEKAEAKAG